VFAAAALHRGLAGLQSTSDAEPVRLIANPYSLVAKSSIARPPEVGLLILFPRARPPTPVHEFPQNVGGRLPNVPELTAALTQITYTFQGDRLLLESEDQIKQRLGYSCDHADALALSFSRSQGLWRAWGAARGGVVRGGGVLAVCVRLRHCAV